MSDAMKVLCVGDTHMNFRWWHNNVIQMAKDHGCRTIFQVGDFGYWENSRAGIHFLDSLSKSLVEANLRVVFLLGNHEDWENIEHYRDAEQSTEGFRKIRDNIYWAPCGSQWMWRNVSFGAVGGAFSIDRGSRVLNQSYFLQEVIDDEKSSEIIDVTEPESVDIMFAHDVGVYVDMKHWLWEKKQWRIMDIAASVESRRQLQKIINHWKPHTFIHGHWHVFYQDKVDDVNYYGLDCEFKGLNSIAVLTIKDDEASITVPGNQYSTRIPIREAA